MDKRFQNLLSSPASYLTVLVVMVTFPHFQYLPWWSIVSILLLAAWRIFIELKILPFPGKIFSALLTLSLASVVYASSGGFTGISAGSHLLVIMTFCKLIESRTYRDYMMLVILSFFIISTNFLFTQSLGTASYMLICLLVAIIVLITINQHKARIKLFDKTKLSLRLIILSIPVMLILFVFFPRITGPLWKTSDDTQQARTGLSDSMEPGQISQLIYSDELVFRARFDKIIPSHNQLYWRAMTLWDFDGQRWTQGNPVSEQIGIQIPEPGFTYNILLEPNQQKWLFLLDYPYTIDSPYQLRSDLTARSQQKISKRIQYTASSSPQITVQQPLNQANRLFAMALPNINPKARKLAFKWKSESKSTTDIIARATNYFSSQSFYYTLSPPGLTREDATDQFLFETRKGFCEHYASAFTVLMRAAGIPSRVVTGYLGGDFNPFTGELSVDQSMAHAWSEVWIVGKGWIRVDPTAAIAPERVEQNLASALKDQTDLPFHLTLNSPLIEKIRQLFDAVESKWSRWVLNYNETSQREFLKFLTGNNMNLKQIGYLFIQVLLIALTLSTLFYFLTSQKPQKDTIQKAYQDFCRKLEKAAGDQKGLAEGPVDFQQRMSRLFPAKKQAMNKIFNLYITIRFKDNDDSSTIKQFLQAVRQFRISSSDTLNS